MKTLTIFTKALLDKGLDYEVTMRGSEVDVRVFDKLNEATVGSSTQDSLEKALATVLANAVSGYSHGHIGLSVL